MTTLTDGKNQQGMSLLEIILAIALASIGVTVLVGLSNNAIQGSGDAKSRSVADQYVREGIDLARSYRDNNTYTSLSSTVGALPKCGTVALQAGLPVITLTSDLTVKQNATYNITTQYYRIICFASTGTANEMAVTVTVAYAFKNSTTPARTSSATTILSNWK